MKRLQYALHDQLIIWMMLWRRRYGRPTRPRWLCWLWHELAVSFNERTFVPKLIAAQEANVGLHEVWAEPTTPPADILAWFDAQIASVPAPLVSMDLIRVGLVRCTLEEWEQGEATGEIALTGERILVEWQGHRTTWERDARPQLVSAIAPDHDGLYCLINGFGDLVQAAFQPLPNEDDDAV